MVNIKKYKNQWVSVSKDYKKVIAHSRELEKLVRKIEQRGSPKGVILRVTEQYSAHVG